MSEVFNKPLLQATLGDLKEVIRELMTENTPQPLPPKSEKKNLVYGLKGLASLLGCSIPTANRIKKEGVIRSATYQVNKLVAFDADEVMNLLRADAKQRKQYGMRTRYAIASI